MTKYILHGGNTKEINPDNDSFFAEMLRGLEGKVVILLNYFARDENEIKDCAEQDKKRFLDNSENKDLDFEVADENKLAEQIRIANVMYIRGGETSKLVEKMKRIPEIEKLFEGKVIGGSSAGVYVLVKHYWGNNNNTPGDGLGIFNLKAFCHYTPEGRKIIKKLQEYKEDLPIIVLSNYKWVVLFK